MSLSSEFFSATINARLEATDVYLPLDPAAQADLLNILVDPTSYVLLTLKGERFTETVKATNQQGTIIIERGLEGTTPSLHHFGTCITTVSPTVMAVVKDLICNYTCCGDEDCPCTPVAYVASSLPTGHVGQDWQGSVIFSGDLPMTAAIASAPGWMQTVQHNNSLVLSGTPDEAGTFTFSVAATNCNGTKLATQAISVTVTV